jgi:hypothetical protein
MRSVHVNAAIRAYLEEVGLGPADEKALESVRGRLLGDKASDRSYLLTVGAEQDQTGVSRQLNDAAYEMLIKTPATKV